MVPPSSPLSSSTGAAHDAALDGEQAKAELEALLEDEREQHTVSLEGLTNTDVFLLHAALHNCAIEHAQSEAQVSAEYLYEIDAQVRAEAPEVIESMEEIETALRDAGWIGAGPGTGPSRFSGLRQSVRSPFRRFTDGGQWSTEDYGWATVFTLCAAMAFTTLGDLLADAVGLPVALSPVGFVFGATGLMGLLLLVGYGVGRGTIPLPGQSTEQTEGE